MYVFNSNPCLNEDDTDITIINHSFLYDGNNESVSSCIPIVRRLQQANQRKSTTSDDSIEVLLDPYQQIEQILNNYHQDLQQDSTNIWTCQQQLITRLVDFLRPIYSTNENQIKILENLSENINQLQDQRTNEFEEKKKEFLIKYSDPIFGHEEWIELEKETLKLQQLVQTQREQIDKLVEILSQRNHLTQCSSRKTEDT